MLQDRLEKLLSNMSESLAQLGVSERQVTCLLAGGYGRGEGGVYYPPDNGPPELYNDLEFYVITSFPGRPPWWEDWVRRWIQEGEERTGIEVEFKWMSQHSLVSGGTTMFTYDLLSAHVPVYGSLEWLEKLPSSLMAADEIPLSEATRLLFNRGSSHYFASYALEKNTPRARDGYVQRLQGKMKLAIGDAVLTASGQYHHSCRERGKRLERLNSGQLPGRMEQIREWHRIGVNFKLSPSYPDWTQGEIESHHRELRDLWQSVFLWVEGTRMERNYADLMEYAHSPENLLPQIPIWKSALLRVRDRVKGRGSLPHVTEYPRGTLQRALACLQSNDHPNRYEGAAKWLNLSTPSEQAVHDAYRHWWHCYN